MNNDCCAPIYANNSTPPNACPTNQQVGQRVELVTLKALLALPLTEITHPRYYFCPDPHCPTVYYSADGTQVFTEAQLRERVYQKHPHETDICVCYCFQHRVAELHQSAEQAGGSRVVAAITQGIQSGQCACEIRNPQGACCLGNVRRALKQLRAAAHAD